MPNRPEYMAIWLGMTSVGGVVALLNTNLVGASLAHCIRAVGPKQHCGMRICRECGVGVESIETAPVVWVHGGGGVSWPRIDLEIAGFSGEALGEG